MHYQQQLGSVLRSSSEPGELSDDTYFSRNSLNRFVSLELPAWPPPTWTWPFCFSLAAASYSLPYPSGANKTIGYCSFTNYSLKYY